MNAVTACRFTTNTTVAVVWAYELPELPEPTRTPRTERRTPALTLSIILAISTTTTCKNSEYWWVAKAPPIHSPMPESCRLWHSKPHYYYYTLLMLLTSPLLAVAVATMAAEAAEGVTTTDSAITSSRRSQAIARHDEFPVTDVAVGERIGSANVMFSLKHLKSRHPGSKSKQSVRTYARIHAHIRAILY